MTTCGALHAVAETLPTGLDGHPSTYEGIRESVRTLPGQVVKPVSASPSLTLEQVRQGISGYHSRIRSLDVAFTQYEKEFIKAAPSVSLAKKGILAPIQPERRERFAMLGDKRYEELFTDNPEWKKAFGKGPFQVTVYNGDSTTFYDVGMQTGSVRAGQKDVKDIGRRYLTIINAYMPGDAKLTSLEEALKYSEFFSVAPQLEEVDGVLCHVVTAGWDTVWIDTEHGFCLRRRVMFRRTSATDQGCLNYVQMCTDFIEADSNLWLPRHCEWINYVTQNSPQNIRGKVRTARTIEADYIRVNEVDDALFDYHCPPGTLVTDHRVKKAYYQPGGIDQLEEAIRIGLPLVNNQVHGDPRKVSQPNWPLRLGLIVANAVVGSTILIFIVWKWRRNRRLASAT